MCCMRAACSERQHCQYGEELDSRLRPLCAEVIQGIAPAELARALKGRVVKDALRKGKNLWLELDEGPALM